MSFEEAYYYLGALLGKPIDFSILFNCGLCELRCGGYECYFCRGFSG